MPEQAMSAHDILVPVVTDGILYITTTISHWLVACVVASTVDETAVLTYYTTRFS